MHSFSGRDDFDVASLRPDQLAQIIDSNPTQRLELFYGTWTPEQSVVLATRPYALNMTIRSFGERGFQFQDDGYAFVDAARTQQTYFGSIIIGGSPFCPANLRHLFNYSTFEKIGISGLNGENAVLPLAAKTNSLVYSVHAQYIRLEGFVALDISAKDLDLKIDGADRSDWTRLLIPLMNRLAELGHMERLKLTSDYKIPMSDVRPFVDALVHAVNSNSHLSHLDLSMIYWLMEFDILEAILIAAEGHAGLRTLVIENDFFATDKFDTWLERVLSRNRNITVLDARGKRITNNAKIVALYQLNRFYNGSAALMKESALVRPLLVTTALAESASSNFQRSGLLLSNHTDTMCELLHELDRDTTAATARGFVPEDVVPSHSRQRGSRRVKRAKGQSLRAKKAARTYA
ncbi:hypothetical protein FisN_10Lu390 [Fistulifera solaris]|jgi:hypothetical protein|uniref:Uncharacterized protein n=1 Tax=Fistulifera solaris TaxID=1519565 RepID=A0A1Z5JUF9_FISSO|nr:hypothetical protein FisN_10Lu390 [Fistulifera solaris]|eukprot:GAX17673.1 hypothetical protein FisN_10Lu390 [Fistulifera solaris]